MVGTLGAALELARELQAPSRLAPETLAEATTVQFPGLDRRAARVRPPGAERLGSRPGAEGRESPALDRLAELSATFGHFGRSGTFLWVDPEAGIALVCLTDRPFGEWAVTAWPRLADAVLAELA